MDTRVVSAGQTAIREWRVKRQTDCHGNTIRYDYIVSPQLLTPTRDANTLYLASIHYCSNSITNAPSTRFVRFGYELRPDLVTQSIQGAIVTWANRLSSISIGVEVGGQSRINRSYTLTYWQSPTTGDSCLAQVVESARDGDGANVVKLLPSLFTYSTGGDPTHIFKTVPTAPFSKEKNIFALVPLNMTGRALADMACMAWDQSSKTFTVNTYVAERDADANISWSPSQNNVSLNMPKWDPTQPNAEAPNFLTPDWHGDGRSDLIIPFENEQGNLEVFLSQSNGIGLTAAQNKQTTFPWAPKSKFMAMDMTGTGVIDIVQIYQNGTKLSLRNFPIIVDASGSIKLGDAYQTDTEFEFDNTIDWFLLKHSGTGAVSLVRVWQEFLSNDPNQYQIKTTSFRCTKVFDSSKGFHTDGFESILGGPFSKEDDGQPKWSVLSCDINGDGTQDIVLGKAEYKDSKMAFIFQVSLGDGLGGFAKISPLQRTMEAPEPKGDGIFSVTNINGGLYPSLGYVFQRKDDGSFICLSIDGRCDGTVSPLTQYPVTADPGSSDTRAMPIDLNGTGMGG
jgi:hypothetical protein